MEMRFKKVKRLGANAESQMIDGSHGFFQTHVTEIHDATSTFLKKID